MPINRISFKISDVMRELSKKKVPRLENIFRIAAQSLWAEHKTHGTTSILEDSMGFFLWECKHPVNRLILETGVQNLTSSNVVQFYSNDSEFFSRKGNALQSLCFIKEALIYEDLFGEPCSFDQIEQHLRDIDCYVPAVLNDMFCMLGIPFSLHTDKDKPRQNTEVLITQTKLSK